MIIVGIDPGVHGGYAVLSDTEGVIQAAPLPYNGRELDVARLADSLDWHSYGIIYIEHVHPMPRNGSIASFVLGHGLGSITAMVTMLDRPYQLVRPQTWKASILAGTKKDKEAAIQYVLRTWPGVNLYETDRSRKAHDGMADAICIAEYGMRQQ